MALRQPGDPLICNAEIGTIRAGQPQLGSPIPINAYIAVPQPGTIQPSGGTVRYRVLLAFDYARQITTKDFLTIGTWNGRPWGGRTYSVLDVTTVGGMGLEQCALLIGDRSAQTG